MKPGDVVVPTYFGPKLYAKQSDETLAEVFQVTMPALAPVACAANDTTVLTAEGGEGAIADYLDSLLIVPLTTSPGKVQVQDGDGDVFDVFKGGADSVATLHSFSIPLGWSSKVGAWSVTTADANVAAVATGHFS